MGPNKNNILYMISPSWERKREGLGVIELRNVVDIESRMLLGMADDIKRCLCISPNYGQDMQSIPFLQGYFL